MEQVRSRLRRWVELLEEQAAIVSLFDSSPLLHTKNKTENKLFLSTLLSTPVFSLQPLSFSPPRTFFSYSCRPPFFVSRSSLSPSLSQPLPPSLCLGPRSSCWLWERKGVGVGAVSGCSSRALSLRVQGKHRAGSPLPPYDVSSWQGSRGRPRIFYPLNVCLWKKGCCLQIDTLQEITRGFPCSYFKVFK